MVTGATSATVPSRRLGGHDVGHLGLPPGVGAQPEDVEAGRPRRGVDGEVALPRRDHRAPLVRRVARRRLLPAPPEAGLPHEGARCHPRRTRSGTPPPPSRPRWWRPSGRPACPARRWRAWCRPRPRRGTTVLLTRQSSEPRGSGAGSGSACSVASASACARGRPIAAPPSPSRVRVPARPLGRGAPGRQHQDRHHDHCPEPRPPCPHRHLLGRGVGGSRRRDDDVRPGAPPGTWGGDPGRSGRSGPPSRPGAGAGRAGT